MKKGILITIAAIVIVALGISAYFIWFHTKTEEEHIVFQVTRISAEGTAQDPCTMEWTAQRTEDGDYTGFTLSVSGFYSFDTREVLDEGDTVPCTSPSGWTYDYFSIPFYSSKWDSFRAVTVLLDHDRQWCILIVSNLSEKPDYFIGTADNSVDPDALLEEYRSYLD